MDNSHIKKQIQRLSDQPGVYQFFDRNNKLLYIGKAKSLKKRVSSYFGNKKQDSYKLKILVSKIVRIEVIVVGSESDALLLENNLIKQYQPHYNILLKDDKTFPWICIKKEAFPRVFSTRNVFKDGSQYFGPYTSAYAVKVLLDLIRKLYKLRNCNYILSDENIRSGKYKVCLEYHLGNCLGPCEGKQDSDSYSSAINQIRDIIKGNLSQVISYLKVEMSKHAEAFRFEEAEQIKEKINVLSRYQAKSTIVNTRINNVDVFSIVSDDDRAYVNFLKVIKGAVIQAHSMEIRKKLNEEDAHILALVIAEMRERIESDAREIIVPVDLSSLFPDINVAVPQKGDKKKLLDLSERNARSYRLDKRKSKSNLKKVDSSQRILEQLKKDLHLQVYPEHIECFDNSNLQGSEPVAACVVFRNARPAKKEYRHFNIKEVVGADDFASMGEVVRRRYRRLLDENKELPQLLVVDGGKGQLNAAVKSLDVLGLRNKIAIIGIAKRLEEIYFPGDSVPLYIDKNSESLKLIQQLRNEAHRFGINFHRQKRSATMVRSSLTELKGIGEGSVELLFREFKSMEAIKEASPDQLARVVGQKRAAILRDYFSRDTV